MKEITITSTINLPDKDEIKAAGKSNSPIEPRQALIISCFVDGDSNDKEVRNVYECMKVADEWHRTMIASDVVAAYCEAHNIKWGVN